MATRSSKTRKPKYEEPEDDNYDDDDYDDGMENDDDADEAPPPRGKKRGKTQRDEPEPRSRKRKPPVDEDDDADADDADADDDDADEAPPPRKRRKPPVEDDAPPPRKRRKPPVEEEEEAPPPRKRRKPPVEDDAPPPRKRKGKPAPEPDDDGDDDGEETIKPYVIPKKYKSCTLLDDGRIRTCAFRALYPALLSPEPSLRDPKVKEYSTKMVFPENVDISILEEEVEALLAKLPASGDKKRARKKMWNPLLTGDDIEDDSEEFEGCTIMKGKSKYKPGLIDARTGEIIEEYEEVYSGMWARATIKLMSFDKSGHKGVRCQLYNVQKLADGEPIERQGNPGDDFDD